MNTVRIHELFKSNCVHYSGNYEVTPGQAQRIVDLIRTAAPTTLPDPLPLPEIGHGIIEYPRLGQLYDRFQVQAFAVAYADASMRAVLGIKVPAATVVTCPYDSWKPGKDIA